MPNIKAALCGFSFETDMRTFTIQKAIDPNTFQPMGHMYLGDTFTGVKFSLELPYDLKCMDAESHKMVIDSFMTTAVATLKETIPDVTMAEVGRLVALCKNALL